MKMKKENCPAFLFRRHVNIPLGLLILSLAQSCIAHEFWIEADALPGSNTVTLDLRVGDGFPGERFPRSTDHIDQFFVQQEERRLTVYGEAGSLPAGVLPDLSSGTHTAGYRSTHTTITLPAEKFESYLIEEGLDHIVDLRRQRGESHLPGREAYSRAAKALVHIGTRGLAVRVNQPLGFLLEIIPQTDPALMDPTDLLSVQVLYAGKPLTGAMVSIFDTENPRGDRTRRTDANGFTQLPMLSTGRILIAVVHMVEAAAELNADWESIWASLTFQAPDPRNRT